MDFHAVVPEVLLVEKLDEFIEAEDDPMPHLVVSGNGAFNAVEVLLWHVARDCPYPELGYVFCYLLF